MVKEIIYLFIVPLHFSQLIQIFSHYIVIVSQMQNVSGKIISGKLENPLYPERSAPAMQRKTFSPAACQTRQQALCFTFWAIFHPPLVKERLSPAIELNVCK